MTFKGSFKGVSKKFSRMFHVTLKSALEVASRRIQGCFEGALRFV